MSQIDEIADWLHRNNDQFNISLILEEFSDEFLNFSFHEFGGSLCAQILLSGEIHIWSRLTTIDIPYFWDSIAVFDIPETRNQDFLDWCNRHLIKGSKVVSYRFSNGGGESKILSHLEVNPEFEVIEVVEFKPIVEGLE